ATGVVRRRAARRAAGACVDRKGPVVGAAEWPRRPRHPMDGEVQLRRQYPCRRSRPRGEAGRKLAFACVWPPVIAAVLPPVPHSHVGHPLEPVPGGGGGCVFVCGGIVGRHIHSGHLLSAWIEALEWLS